MKIEDYQQFTRKLAKRGLEIYASLTPQKCELWHIASAWVGETWEMALSDTRENILEELGDGEFYGAEILNLLELKENVRSELEGEESLSPSLWNTEMKRYGGAVANVFDVVKKNVIYEKALNIELLQKHLGEARYRRDRLYRILGVTAEEVRQKNFDKLSVRYPGLTFTNKAAQERKDKQQ